MGIICRRFDPCGKGKMERFIETAILQLPVWFRRYEVKSKTLGNLVLEKYIRYYNMVEMHREIKTTAYDRFSALRKESKFTLIVDDEVDLDKVFSYREERKANGDNTIRFNGEVYQLERKPFIYSYAGKKAEIRYLPDKFLSIYLDGELVTYRKLLTVTKERLKSESEKYGKVAIL